MPLKLNTSRGRQARRQNIRRASRPAAVCASKVEVQQEQVQLHDAALLEIAKEIELAKGSNVPCLFGFLQQPIAPCETSNAHLEQAWPWHAVDAAEDICQQSTAPPPPLAFEKSGGLPVLVLHGVLGSHRNMRNIQEALARAGIESLALDLLGFGQSPWEAEEYDVDGHITAILAALPASWSEYIVLGHSFGALLSQELKVRDARCLGCICVGTPAMPSVSAFYEHIRKNKPMTWVVCKAPSWVTWMMCATVCKQRWALRPLVSMTYSLLGAVSRSSTSGFKKVLMEDFFNHSHRSFRCSVHGCLVPLMTRPIPKDVLGSQTVFVHGEKDLSCPLTELRRKIGGSSSNSRVVTLKDEGHLSILQRGDTIAAEVLRLQAKIFASCRRSA